ncbi:aKG-HExxH-type peptide beta-hydroxylase [Nocardia sp. NPDC049149]|uniref:aKG-HExxH-type peptide beta-hydroxylase n=1 Tax=Nocardia sp. NPDC049149 TaxID=3364315 RepID=UPI003722CB48
MDVLNGVFRLQQTDQLHQTRTAAIHSILNTNGSREHLALGDQALAYALAHHYLEGAEQAARSGNLDEFHWYKETIVEPPATWFEPTARGRKLAQSPTPEDMQQSPLADAPYYVVGPRTTRAPRHTIDLVTAALNIAASAGFGDLVDNHAPIICLLRSKAPTDTLDSWTISRLPGTIFLDHINDPTVLARDIVHEAGHNWLNDALAATEIAIHDSRTYYSPWKRTPRPAFGFLHACWSFPLTMLFTATAGHLAPGPVEVMLQQYLEQQQRKLSVTAADHADALQLVDNASVRDRLRAVYAAATVLG